MPIKWKQCRDCQFIYPEDMHSPCGHDAPQDDFSPSVIGWATPGFSSTVKSLIAALLVKEENEEQS